MENVCQNCKFYEPPQNKYNKDNDRRTCKCNKFVYLGDNKNYPLNDKLEYYDYESYSAGFFVGKNFGCIHFKPNNL